MENQNQLELKNIDALIREKNFYIPSYQRGYRWSQSQVTDLLNDLFYFLKKEKKTSEFYCLQPIVVFKSNIENIDYWELIDGQQRLTTIHIILSFFNKRLTDEFKKDSFELEYKTRAGSKDFLKNITEELSKSNIDYYFIFNAYNTIKNWFSDKQSLIGDFETILLTRTYVIWYEIDTKFEKPIDLFTRINIGKIPLTNAELIKALFLQKSNFKDSVEISQQKIGSEWDDIEKKLQNDSFWYFIHNAHSSNHYDNRIEYIFDLIQGDKKTSNLSTFYYFNSKFEKYKTENKINFVEIEWKEIKEYFQRLEEWYSNHELYHYIGFLIENDISVSDLIIQSKSLDKDLFNTYLIDCIKNKFKTIDIRDLDYNDDKKNVKMTLLLFNILTIISSEKAIVKFPFDKYKKENWNIEHVNSQTHKSLTKIQDQKKWSLDLFEYYLGIDSNSINQYLGMENKDNFDQIIIDKEIDFETVKILNNLLSFYNSEKIDNDEFLEFYTTLQNKFDDNLIKDNDNIYNLALLDAKTNSSYGNSFFPIKRKRIIENDQNGLFVPICTKNLFLKYYSKKIDNMMVWEESDAKDYISELIKMTTKFLN